MLSVGAFATICALAVAAILDAEWLGDGQRAVWVKAAVPQAWPTFRGESQASAADVCAAGFAEQERLRATR